MEQMKAQVASGLSNNQLQVPAALHSANIQSADGTSNKAEYDLGNSPASSANTKSFPQGDMVA